MNGENQMKEWRKIKYLDCPTCQGVLKGSDLYGKYCSKCGLIISTFQKARNVTIKNDRRTIKAVPIIKRYCQGCKTQANITLNHIIPKREGLKTRVIILCRKCHNIADELADTLYPLLHIGESNR